MKTFKPSKNLQKKGKIRWIKTKYKVCENKYK